MRPIYRNKTKLTHWAIPAFVSLFSITGSPTALAEDNPFTQQVRYVTTESLGISNPIGMAYSSQSKTLLIGQADQTQDSHYQMTGISLPEDLAKALSIETDISNPINISFDPYANRILILNKENDQDVLITISTGENGSLNNLERFDASSFGLVNPQGMTVDTATGMIYILDTAGPSILRVEADPTGGFTNAQTVKIDLSATGLNNLQGIAFNPNDGYIYVLDTVQLNLAAVSLDGQIQSTRNLSKLTISDPQSMVFAPSVDFSDDESEMSLYINNKGINGVVPGITEITLTAFSVATKDTTTTFQAVGDTVASLENIIKTYEFNPASPDPSGISYIPSTNTLLISDGEIEELPVLLDSEQPELGFAPLLFEGYNLFEIDLIGGLTNTFSTVEQSTLDIFAAAPYNVPLVATADFSDEPTGISEVNPDNNHIFISDDDRDRIWEVDPSTDGIYGTSDDVITFFQTVPFTPTSGDPEGVAYAAELGDLFIVDGDNNEVYKVSPGLDGAFNTAGDNIVTHFDTQALGILDPEGIAYSQTTGNLFIVSSTTATKLFEVSTSGALVREIDISAATTPSPDKLRKASGITFIPNTQDPAQAIVYITDRANDNDFTPGENDGLVFEMSFPFSDIINQAPTVTAGPDQSITLPETGSILASLDGTVSDDGFPSPPNTVDISWTKVSGPGIVGFSSATLEDTLASFSTAGIYVMRLTATDTELQTSDEITITVNSPSTGNQPPTVDAGPDQTITLTADITLDATVTDDGLPTPPSTITTLWSKISGPGTVTFADASAEDTTANFSEAGTYVLQINADDSALQSNSQITITVADIGGGSTSTIEVRVDSSSDDAEERETGKVILSSSDLELVFDSGNQTVGMRFNNILVPPGAVIVDAFLQFQSDETNPQNTTTLTIEGEATANPATFTSADDSISTRPRTTNSTQWTPAPWTSVHEEGPDQKTPNISAIIQELVGTGWTSGNSMVLLISGTGERTAESFDGRQSGAPLLHIEYATGPVTNQAPTVNAGPDQGIAFSTDATLDGTVSDDGLPTPTTITTLWSMTSGPGVVTFADASAVDTTASFSAAGTYVLQLSADDSELVGLDEIIITVTVVSNEAPTVNAGPDQSIALSVDAILDGTATDDGLPTPTNLTILWTQTSGPGTATFADDSLVDTSANFSEAGTYVLQLTADDGAIQSNDEVTITVTAGGGTATLEVRVSASSDDAEESTSGKMTLSSSDLELVYDKTNQTVGIRFNGITVPAGALITNAYVQFQTDETSPNNATTLTIEGELSAHAATFSSATGNISARPKTTASEQWLPNSWTISNEAGLNQRTPNISSIIQEVINSGWTSGNSLALIITGTGERTAESYDGKASAAPLLHIEYSTGPLSNQAPAVNAGPDQTIALSADATLDGTVTDDSLPSPEALTTLWTKVSGPGTATFADATAVDTTVGFSVEGTYVLRLTADDTEFTPSDDITITVNDTSGGVPTTIDVRVSADSDDAEEKNTGKVTLSSSDLELVYDKTNQTVGIRFTGLDIPQGSIITNAHVQFQVDETNPQNATDLIIEGEATANTGTFISTSGNISSRLKTLASSSWSPAPWTSTNDAGPDQQTPDISSIIQEIVDSGGATTVNSLVLIITGTGERTAESHDGNSSAAPLLHVEFIAPPS